MNAETLLELNRIADRYTSGSTLNALLKLFFQRKIVEQSIWAELTTVTHRMFMGSSTNITRIAAVTEMLLLALDVVDDLQDGDNPDVPWMQSDPRYALNAVLSLIFATLGELGSLVQHESEPIALMTISNLLSASVLGQHLDLSNSIQSEQDYMSMIREKSGSLLRLSCFIGYSTAGVRDKATSEVMDELADTIGIISQIRNDIRDVKNWETKSDLLQKKKTLPVLYMLADEGEGFAPLQDYYEGKMSQAEFLNHKEACMEYIERCGCIEYALIIMTLFKNRADQLLELLDVDSEWKIVFRKLTLGSSS